MVKGWIPACAGMTDKGHPLALEGEGNGLQLYAGC